MQTLVLARGFDIVRDIQMTATLAMYVVGYPACGLSQMHSFIIYM